MSKKFQKCLATLPQTQIKQCPHSDADKEKCKHKAHETGICMNTKTHKQAHNNIEQKQTQTLSYRKSKLNPRKGTT